MGSVLEGLGASPIGTSVNVGMGKFTSIFRKDLSPKSGIDFTPYARAYTKTRGILIEKRHVVGVNSIDLKKGHIFQINPETVHDTKSTIYEPRPYAGLSYNDYAWGGGGERIVTFQLFLDDTPQSKTPFFRPESYGSKLAKTVKTEGSTGKIEYTETGAYSVTRISERGILNEVEKIQSFLYPATLDGEETPRFAEGGVVSHNQFRPPSTVIFTYGLIYLEGIIKSAPVTYSLFDEDLTPIRGTIDIEFAVHEFESLTKRIPTNDK